LQTCHYTYTILKDLLEYEEDTERGTMKILDNITWRRFWEATDRAALLKGHENAPKAKLDDLVDVLTEPEVYDGESQIHIAFTATIIWIERDELFEQLYWIRILPCGWRWEAGMNKDLRLVLDGKQTASDDDLKNMVYRTYRFSGNCGAVPSPNNWPRWLDKMQDPEPTGPSKGCCFKVVGSVTKVDGEQVEVHVAQEPTRMMETQELERLARQITVHLVKGVDQPEMGSSYVFKGLFEPFAKEMQDTNFMAEV
jgi:hypothetical protein